jgi:DNA-binding NarL/FixJ family response regulator
MDLLNNIDMKTLSVYIIDDHELFREGIKLMLERFPNLEVIGDTATGESFLASLSSVIPDLILLDIDLPGIGGEAVCTEALKIAPYLKIIAVSNFTDEEYYHRMLTAGAHGYVAKTLSSKELSEAIKIVSEGGYYFSEYMLRSLMRRRLDTINCPQNHVQCEISKEEHSILDMLSSGKTEAEIAERMGCSIDTLNSMTNILLEKTNSKDNIDLLMYAVSLTMKNSGYAG